MNFNKQVMYATEGKDQLGKTVGKPQPGDVVKVHMKASFSAELPSFQLGKKKFGVKLRKKEFLSTQMVGDTAFLLVDIPSKPSTRPTTVDEVLADCIRTMFLGETALFLLDFASLDPKMQNLFKEKIHKGHYKNIAKDSKQVFLEIDSYRLVRDKVEHHRPNRNGTGGGFSMGGM